MTVPAGALSTQRWSPVVIPPFTTPWTMAPEQPCERLVVCRFVLPSSIEVSWGSACPWHRCTS